MRIIDISQLGGRATTRGKVARQAAMLTIPLDFGQPYASDTLKISINVLSGIRNTTGLDTIQSLYIDNSLNGGALTVTLDNGSILNCPPYSTAMFPLFFSGEVFNALAYTPFFAAVSSIVLLNTREVPFVWRNSDLVSPSVSTYTDKSLVHPGGSSQPLMVANANRKSFLIANPSTAALQGIGAAESIFINFGNAASAGLGSIEIIPGGRLTAADVGVVSQQAINVFAATANHIINAKDCL